MVAGQVAERAHGRAREVRDEPGGRGQGEFDQPLGDVPRVHRLPADAAQLRDDRQLGHRGRGLRRQVVELGGAQHGVRDARADDGLLGGVLGPEVAERHPVGADHRDVHQVLHPGPPGGGDQVAGGGLVVLGVPGQVQDHLDPGEGRVDALPAVHQQVAGQVLDAVGGRSGVAGEHPDVAAGRPQQRYDVAAEGAGAAGHENGGVGRGRESHDRHS